MAAPDYNAIYQQSLEQARTAAQPAISSLEAQRPTLEAAYNTQRADITNQQGLATKNLNTQTTRDLSGRGIDPNSGLFSQTLGERTEPLVQYYTGQLNNATSGYNSNVADLASRIAGLQSGYQQSAIQAAQGRYGQEYDTFNRAQEAEKDRAFQAQQAALSRNSSAASSAADRAAQANSYKQAQDQLNANNQKQLLSTAISALGQVGNKDVYVDANEANLAYRSLVANGYPADQAKAVLEQAMQQGGYKKYKW